MTAPAQGADPHRWEGGPIPGLPLRRQTVYSKALALFVLLSFLLGTAIVSMSQYLILGQFRESERRDMGASVTRLSTAIGREISELSALVQIRSKAPLPATRESPDTPGLDFLAAIDARGQIELLEVQPSVRMAGGALERDLASILEGLPGGKLERSGCILLNNRLALLSWHPMDQGRALVAGRFFDDGLLQQLQELFSGRIIIEPLIKQVYGPPGSEDLLDLLSTGEPLVRQYGASEITGSVFLRGLDRSPLVLVTLSQKPTLEREGRTTVQIFLTVIVLAGGFLFFFIWVLMDRTILARIRELTRQVELEKMRGRLPVELAFRGDDELGTLARSIEELAVLLEKAQQQYRTVVEDQTEIICRFDQNSAITFANGVFNRAFTPQANPRGALLSDTIPAAAADFLQRRFARLTPGQPIDTFHHRIQYAGGAQAWLRSTLRANFSPAGEPTGGQWVAADVTLQVEAELGVQESERQLRTLSNRLLHLQDEERRRIARELHDSTAQSLSALEMHVSLLEPAARDERTRRIVDETRRIARECCQELRSISYLLHPPLLDEVGLAFAVRWFADGFGERTGIDVDVEIPADFPRLDSELETALFRIVQEATSNIYKHSGAETASIELSAGPDNSITMVIRDNGRGFPEKDPPQNSLAAASGQPRPGIGLAGMRERVRQFEGELKIDNSPGGVTISVRIPPRYASPVRK